MTLGRPRCAGIIRITVGDDHDRSDKMVGLRHAGRAEAAEAELRKVLEIDENFPLALDTLGAVCTQQGRFDEALTLTERAYALTPWASRTVGQLAALLVRAGATGDSDNRYRVVAARS